MKTSILFLSLALVASGLANAQFREPTAAPKIDAAPALPTCVTKKTAKAKLFPGAAVVYYCPGWALVAPLSWKPIPTEAMASSPADLLRMREMASMGSDPNLLKAEAAQLAK